MNDDTVKSWDDLQAGLLKSGPEARIKVAGRSEPVTVHMPSDTAARVRLVSWGILPFAPARIGLVYPGEPGARAGLRPGDVVVRADGDTVRSWNDLLLTLWSSAGKPVHLSVLRDTARVQLTVTPRAQTEEDSTSVRPRTYGFIGAEGDFHGSRNLLAKNGAPFDFFADIFERKMRPREDSACQPFTLSDQAEKEMLGLNRDAAEL